MPATDSDLCAECERQRLERAVRVQGVALVVLGAVLFVLIARLSAKGVLPVTELLD